jgi:peptidoglycan/LPS O-acetylase OafA/YrhL
MSVNLFHIGGVAPLLGYTAYAGASEPLPFWLVWVLVILAVMVVAYHSYRYYEKTFVKNDDINQ